MVREKLNVFDEFSRMFKARRSGAQWQNTADLENTLPQMISYPLVNLKSLPITLLLKHTRGLMPAEYQDVKATQD